MQHITENTWFLRTMLRGYRTWINHSVVRIKTPQLTPSSSNFHGNRHCGEPQESVQSLRECHSGSVSVSEATMWTRNEILTLPFSHPSRSISQQGLQNTPIIWLPLATSTANPSPTWITATASYLDPLTSILDPRSILGKHISGHFLVWKPSSGFPFH